MFLNLFLYFDELALSFLHTQLSLSYQPNEHFTPKALEYFQENLKLFLPTIFVLVNKRK